MNFALSALGETIYFINPDQPRVLDAVQFGGQENGVATGRWPDGADQFFEKARCDRCLIRSSTIRRRWLRGGKRDFVVHRGER